MNSGTFSIWSTDFAYDCKKLTIILDRQDFGKESRKTLFSKDYWKKYDLKGLQKDSRNEFKKNQKNWT